MAKCIKRAGTVFFAIVLSLLLLIGTLYATDIVEINNILNIDSENLVLDENNVKNSTSNLDLSKNADYILKGNCDDIAGIWNKAVSDSVNNARIVKVVMQSDWIAKEVNNNYTTMFGEGEGFIEGKVFIPKNANLTLDLNGHKIDRNLFNTTGGNYGFCILIYGNMSIIDSTYDSNEVYKLLASGNLTQENVDKLNFGKIMGGNNNSASFYGSGIRAANGGVLNFYSGIICNNKSIDGAGLTSMRNGYINFYDGLIFGNVSVNHGAGVCVGIESTVVMRGGFVANNTSTCGAGVFVYSVSTLDIRNTIITNNVGTTTTINNNLTTALGGGTYVSVDCVAKVGVGTQIYGNLCDNKDNNLYLNSENLVQVSSGYLSTSDIKALYITNVGISLEKPRIFTTGFTTYNNQVSPATFFFSDNSAYSIVKNGNEAELVNSAATLETLTWKYDAKSTTNRLAVVTYSGNPYTVSAEKGNIYRFGYSAKPSFEVTNAGVYAFCSTGTFKNNVFTLIILPKEVDLTWITNLTYNGSVQQPTVRIKTGQLLGTDECKVFAFGEATDVGNDYYAEARTLSNINYKIKDSSKSANFNILPANLTINITTENAEKHFNGNVVDLGDSWYNLSATLLGQDSKKSLNSVFNIDYSKFIPMFTKDGVTTSSAVNVGKYDISVKEFDANSVFTGNDNYNVTINYVNGGILTISMAQVIRASVESGYSYLLLDENNKRTAYETKGLVHGENDSNVNIKEGKATYVLGNIKPNTGVNTFINNLVFDTAQINLYNSQGKLIYTNGGANEAEGITEDMLNSRLELAVGTGWYIEYNVGGNVETIYLSVLGDINGDGRISASDCAYIRELAINETIYNNLSVEYKLAGLIINKGGITTADSEIILNVMAYKLTIDLFY